MSTDIRPDDPEALEQFCEMYLADAIEAATIGDADAIHVSLRDLGKDPGVREYYEAVLDGDIDAACEHMHDAVLKVASHPMELEETPVRIVDIPEFRTDDPSTVYQADVQDFVAVEGQIAKVTGVKKEPIKIFYQCQRCPASTPGVSTGNGFQEPAECQGCERQGPFRIDFEKSEFRSYQRARIKQPPEQAASGDGEHVDVEVRDDLVNRALAGDRVTMAGNYHLEGTGDGLFEGYVKAQSVEHDEENYEEIDIDAHKDEIQAIANGEYGDPFDLLVESIAPKIHGYDTIKRAIALQLFGGSRPEFTDGSHDRGDIHMLLLGDPGCGKSSLLRAVEEIAPRSVYASGKGATEAGMTAAVTFDDFGDTPASLEAGALVTAHKGIACVDELDKIPENVVSSLHDALESQRVNINKGGINAPLPAETAMLAAGNPKHGRFHDTEPIADQIDLGPTLLSRFDLLWMVDDDPDEARDREIASHMVRARQTANLHASDATVSDDDLKSIKPAIPTDLLRAYIAYAKRRITPRLTDDELAESLVESFADLRGVNGDDGPVPVTFRKLEGIQRLAEASARARLSETVEREDVERAKRLIGESMRQVTQNENDQLDADVVEAGQSMPQKQRRDLLKQVVDEIAAEHEDGAPVGKVIDTMCEEGLDRDRVKKDIDVEKTKGNLYEPSGGCLRVVH